MLASAGGILPDGAGADSLPWFEIVGVVKDLGMVGAAETTPGIGLYQPGRPGSGFPPQMMIRTQGDPMALVPRVRAIAGKLDPTLRLSEFQRVDQVADDLVWILGMWMRMTLMMTAVALLLSLAGIYAVLSFIVARRTREIGVRVALGASRRGVITVIFRRPLTQVGFGIAGGATLIALGILGLSRTTQFESWPKGLSLGQVALLVAYAAFMLAVCLLACVVPTWRALRVQPIVAMRVDWADVAACASSHDAPPSPGSTTRSAFTSTWRHSGSCNPTPAGRGAVSGPPIGTRTLFHMEGGKGATSKAIRSQFRAAIRHRSAPIGKLPPVPSIVTGLPTGRAFARRCRF